MTDLYLQSLLIWGQYISKQTEYVLFIFYKPCYVVLISEFLKFRISIPNSSELYYDMFFKVT